VMSMEARAFGAFPTRTFVEAPRMGGAGMAVCAMMAILVLTWYAALIFGFVHSFYVFAPA
jgi:energy-coupling factor transport system permease protein